MSVYSIKDNINDFMKDFSHENSVCKGRMFLEWVLGNVFNRTPEEIQTNDLDGGVLIPDGSNDKGIDAAFIDGESIYLIQTKYNKSHSKDSVQAFKVKMEEFINNKDGSGYTHNLVKIHDAMLDDSIYSIKIYYITDIDLTSEKATYMYDEFERDLIAKGPKEKDVTFCAAGVENIKSITMGILEQVPKEIRVKEVRFIFANSFLNRDSNTIVGEMPIKELASIVKKHETFIFHSNIRNFLGKNKINKSISETFNKQPKDFWFFNNGITIVCSDFSKVSSSVDNQYKVTGPQIVNGCQTSTTIMREWISNSN